MNIPRSDTVVAAIKVAIADATINLVAVIKVVDGGWH